MPDANMLAVTVIDLFSRMNREGIDYVLLRNYELYPEFGHDIDLIVRERDLPGLKAAAASCATDHGWIALTECDHWARSASLGHRFQKLRFYTTDPPQCLQIDVFHSLWALGVPLIDEDALLQGRLWDHRGFYRIDGHVENLYRLLQIANNLSVKSDSPEIMLRFQRYRERVLSFLETAVDFAETAAALGFPKIPAALALLRSGDLLSFKKEIDRQKRAWLRGRLAAQPFRTVKMLCDRSANHLQRFWLRPCGFAIRAFAGDAQQRARLERVMGQLAEANVVSAFTSSRSFKERLRVKAAGGIILEWTSRESAQVVMDGEADAQRVMTKLLTLLVERHPKVMDRRDTLS